MIIVRLTRAELIAAGADCDGLEVFDTLARRQSADGQTLTYEWTLDRQLWCATCPDVRHHVYWLQSIGLAPTYFLRNADLREAELRAACLSKADLCGADLRWADLRWANLRGAELRGADLSYADLSYADLSEAELRRANLRGADLRDANLRKADLREADLSWADLSGALRHDTEPLIPGWRVRDGRLERAS